MSGVGFSAAALGYFAERAISPEIAASLGVREEAGALIFGDTGRRRALNGAAPKVHGAQGVPLAAWWPTGPPQAGGADVLVTEGESDALAVLSALPRTPPPAGIADLKVLSIPGVGFPVDRLVRELAEHRVRGAVTAFDADGPGRQYQARAVEALRAGDIEPISVELPEGSSDLADFLAARDGDGPNALASLLADAAATVDRGEQARPTRLAESLEGVRARSVGEIRRERVEWLEPGRIPLRGLTLLVGDPGLGKSLATCDRAARVSRGGLGPAGAVLMVTAEDSIGAVVRPRLEAVNADLSRVHVVTVRREGIEEGISLPDDAAELGRLVAETKACLVVIDPLMAHLPERVNSWRDQAVRRALAPLHRLAEEHGCAVVVVAHLNKALGADPLYRTGGSVGIPAAARSALVLTRDPDDPEGERGRRRVLAHFKSNYGELAPSLTLEIEPVLLPGSDEIRTARIREVGESDHAARDLLALPDGEARTERDEAADFLLAELAGGSQPAKQIKMAARDADIAERTLKRAKAQLGVLSRKDGLDGGWIWQLPPERGQAPVSKVAPFAAQAGNPSNMGGRDPEGGQLIEMATFDTERAGEADS